MNDYIKNYEFWVNSGKLTADEAAELESIKADEKEIKERFSCYLSFGTAGLRGIMKTGMNAMNVRTVAHATMGVAKYIIKEGRAADGVVIGHDSRNNSRLFAKTAAGVLAANGIKVYIFDDLRPTPEISFALRHLGCVSAINVTASHNPKEYNGYKVYWEDGAQIGGDVATAISDLIAKTDIFDGIVTTDFDEAVKAGKIEIISDEIDEKYLAAVMAEAVNPDIIKQVADELKIVYSPLHGAGYKMVPEMLRRMGLKHLYIVKEQGTPDGNFPTVQKPNPEYLEVFNIGIDIADDIGSDLIVATDPDADRIGAIARAKDGKFVRITGNQMGALLLNYILTAYEDTNTMPVEPYAIKTIVTTELAAKVCEAHGVEIFNVLTGFKFIGEVIKNHEAAGHGSFVFGFEESYGYLKGNYARDKDAVVATMLVTEMTAYYKTKGMTLIDALEDLWERIGYSFEYTEELFIPGLDGAAQIKAIMENFRENAPKSIGGVKVVSIGDYLNRYFIDTATGEKSHTGLPRSNVMYFKLENGDVVVARPSGTEPKIKFYYLITSASKENANAVLEAYMNSVKEYRK